ncbi:MAG: hypothetical protein HY692_06425, partial [Cyanobacteria bacterium NC_groundwater_1444_Ag_S-0.65um_54_12]|nr:hypothetical protein [Cyanobacteria bacterium NC_groundwater_1444_Ag_S-0.65um_54_12]
GNGKAGNDLQKGIVDNPDTSIDAPLAVAVDQANRAVYFTDTNNGQVVRIDGDLNAVPTFTATVVAKDLDHPGGITFNPATKHLLIADTSSNRILVWDGVTGLHAKATCSATADPATAIIWPQSLALVGAEDFPLYFSDFTSNRIRILNIRP